MRGSDSSSSRVQRPAARRPTGCCACRDPSHRRPPRGAANITGCGAYDRSACIARVRSVTRELSARSRRRSARTGRERIGARAEMSPAAKSANHERVVPSGSTRSARVGASLLRRYRKVRVGGQQRPGYVVMEYRRLRSGTATPGRSTFVVSRFVLLAFGIIGHPGMAGRVRAKAFRRTSQVRGAHLCLGSCW